MDVSLSLPSWCAVVSSLGCPLLENPMSLGSFRHDFRKERSMAAHAAVTKLENGRIGEDNVSDEMFQGGK